MKDCEVECVSCI